MDWEGRGLAKKAFWTMFAMIAIIFTIGWIANERAKKLEREDISSDYKYEFYAVADFKG